MCPAMYNSLNNIGCYLGKFMLYYVYGIKKKSAAKPLIGDVDMGKSPPTNDLKRSHTMSRVKNKNTSIEVSLRKALWHSGIRYRKNYNKLPGAPDIAITKYRIAVFCDGEFWHGKDWDAKKPKIQSNRDYWINKIERNISRDYETGRLLYGMGWIVVRFWGMEIRDNLSGCVEEISDLIFQAKIDAHNIDWGLDGKDNDLRMGGEPQ